MSVGRPGNGRQPRIEPDTDQRMGRPTSFGVDYQLESRMPEICQSGSEGGASLALSLPLSQPGVLTPGEQPIKRLALKGPKVLFDQSHT